jgi:hypothetical protein
MVGVKSSEGVETRTRDGGAWTMNSLLDSEAQQEQVPTLARQALSFFLHSLAALATWVALMALGYALNPVGVPQWVILLLSVAAPLAVGWVVTKIRPNEIATAVWLAGLIWLMIAGLYVLDLPTGPGQCPECSAPEKLLRTFFSLPGPSGLMDNDGPFLATWPAAALVGYSIGAWLGRRRQD